MEYITKKVLAEGEKIVEEVELSKVRLVVNWIIGILFFWILLIPLFYAIKTSVCYATTEIVITNKNVIKKTGWINVTCEEQDIHKIEKMDIQRSFGGKIFDYGNLFIKGSGRGGINLEMIKNPENVRQTIIALKEEHSASH